MWIIPLENLENLKVKWASLQKKARKLIGQEITLTYGNRVTKVLYSSQFNRNYTRQCIEVTIDSPMIVINGWHVIGVVKCIGDKNIICSTYELNEKYRTLQECQHCNINRNRKELIILRNESNEEKLVGSTCLKDFLGHDPQKIVSYASFLKTIPELLEQEECDETDNHSNGVVSLQLFLTIVKYLINKKGFTSKAQENATGNKSTAEEAYDFFVRKQELPKEVWNITEQEIMEVISWAKNIQTESNYHFNLKSIAELEFVNSRSIGIAASIFIAYEKAKNVDKPSISEYLGVIGEGIELIITVKNIIELNGQYGRTYLVTMQSGENVLTWFASTKPTFTPTEEPIKIKGKIKAHKDFRGVKQTVLKLVKVLKMEKTEKTDFSLNEDLIRICTEETRRVQCVLEGIFADDQIDEPTEDIASNTLDKAHQALFQRLVQQETWERSALHELCKELGLMIDGAMEALNEWSFDNVNAPLIDDGDPVFVDISLADALHQALTI